MPAPRTEEQRAKHREFVRAARAERKRLANVPDRVFCDAGDVELIFQAARLAPALGMRDRLGMRYYE